VVDRKLAPELPNLSKQLRSRLRNGSSMDGALDYLSNHTCCPHHRNSELQILSVWQEDRTSAILQGPAGDGPGARNSTAPGRTLLASLRATKLIRKGMPVLTCYRNTSSAGLIKERETLSSMFQCLCCLCGGSYGVSSSEVGLSNAAPSFLLDLEVPASGGSNTDSKPVEKVEIAQKHIRAAIQTPLREVLRPLPALGPRRLHLHLPLAYPLPCNCSGARPLTNERPLDLIQWGINRLSEAGSRRHFDHGQTSSLALPADSRLRSYRRRDLSTNFPTFVQRFYLTQSQGNSCTSHPHTQASPS